MNKKILQWHPAFQAALQVELVEDRAFLQFHEEYNLTKKPLRMDTLVIKLKPGHVVRKSIGRIFRQHNIVEYKSPEDYIWLSRLRGDLSVEYDIKPLAKAYKGKSKDPQYQAIMDLIVRANKQQYEEGQKMCEALRELFADELEEREARGMERGALLKLISLVRKKCEKGLSAEQAAEVLEEKEDTIKQIYLTLQANPGSTDEEIYSFL